MCAWVPDVGEEACGTWEEVINSHVFMRWEKYGWQLGKTTEIITRSTPRLFKQY